MKTLVVLLPALLSLACRSLQENPAKALAEKVIGNTRSQKAYEVTFKATLTPPRGDRIEYSGRCVWVAPGTLYIHMRATGGVEQKIVRVGNTVWAYHHELEDWFPADEMGLNGAGRGIQNPGEILDVLLRNLDGAKLLASGDVEAEFDGASLEKVMQSQASKGAFDWKNSKAKLGLSKDDQHRLKTISCTATLRPTDPNVPGDVTYSGTVEAQGYNGATELKFRSGNKDIPLSEEIRKAIDKEKK